MSTEFNLPTLPHAPGVYLMRDSAATILYVGKSRDLKKRVSSYFMPNRRLEPRLLSLVTSVRHVDYVPTASEREALVLEQKLIKQYQPAYNVMLKDGKTYPYVALTMGEDFPRLILTRQKKRDRSLYFGPYPNVSQVRQLLKWAWRKRLFPLRPCKLAIEEGKPWPYEKVKSCLYLHTGQCPAPCVARVSRYDYALISQRAKWFFSGQQQKMVVQWEKEMRDYSAKEEFEQAAHVRDRIETLRHMKERVTFREMTEPVLDQRVGESRAMQELMKALKLKTPPQRIECFDISHIQGVEKVASMVSFDRGRPDKSKYRKFIIRTVDGIDDFRSMAEVVGRRYRRLRKEGKPFPDLVLIDGGKGQLSFALKAIKAEKISGLAVAAIAKQEEEVFLPGESESIRFPMDSPALLLLRAVRDEAHRFAITFHRLRRHKRTFLV